MKAIKGGRLFPIAESESHTFTQCCIIADDEAPSADRNVVKRYNNANMM